jgi:hypothetical protein
MSNTAPADPVIQWKTPLLYNDNPASYAFGSAAAGPGAIDTPGIIRTDADPAGGGQRTFVLALLANSANVVAGQVVYFDSPNNIANIPSSLIPQGVTLGNSCVFTSNLAQTVGANTTGTQQDMVAAVAIQNQTNGKFGWFQKTGSHPGVLTSGGTINGGDLLISSTTSGQVTGVAANVTSGSGVAVRNVGRAMANAANNSVPAVLSLPNF